MTAMTEVFQSDHFELGSMNMNYSKISITKNLDVLIFSSPVL